MVKRCEIGGTAEALLAGKRLKVAIRKNPIVKEQWKLKNNECMRADTLYSLRRQINLSQSTHLDGETNSFFLPTFSGAVFQQKFTLQFSGTSPDPIRKERNKL